MFLKTARVTEIMWFSQIGYVCVFHLADFHDQMQSPEA